MSRPCLTTIKVCDLVYKAVHHSAPVYPTELCVPVSIHQGRANLRSATHGDWNSAANKGTTYGRRSFAVSGPTTWNMLSLSTREQSLSFGQVRSRLTTELFNRANILLSCLVEQARLFRGVCATVSYYKFSAL